MNVPWGTVGPKVGSAEVSLVKNEGETRRERSEEDIYVGLHTLLRKIDRMSNSFCCHQRRGRDSHHALQWRRLPFSRFDQIFGVVAVKRS